MNTEAGMNTEEAQKRCAAMLRLTADLVAGDRAEAHGDLHVTFRRIADLWRAYGVRIIRVTGTKACNTPPTAEDVALLMGLLKIGRTISTDAPNKDNYLDMAGYAAIAGELSGALREGRKKGGKP